MVKFTLFSISAGVIQALSFTLLHEIGKLIYWPAYLIALTLSVIWNFTFNRKFTFKSAANVPVAMFKIAMFYVVFTSVTTILGHYITENGVNDYIVLGVTMVSNLILEFIYTKYYVYKDQINTAVK